MSAEHWYPNLPETDQAWLSEHIGKPLPREMVQRVIDAGGVVYTAHWVNEPPKESTWALGYGDWVWIESQAGDDFMIVPTGKP